MGAGAGLRGAGGLMAVGMTRHLEAFSDPRLPPRFWAKVCVGSIPAHRPDLGPCWEWTAYTDETHPYGRFWFNGAHVSAHRFAYKRLSKPIPPGLTIDHLCRFTRCVRPAHMEPVSMRVNTLRGISPVARNASKMICVNGHPLIGPNLRLRPDGNRRCRACKRTIDRASYPRRRDYLIAYNKSHREQGRETSRRYRERQRAILKTSAEKVAAW